jgi:poly(beta-D-mannuronate) lyase
MLARLAVMVSLAVICATAAPASAQPCPQPPVPVRNIDVPRFYADKAGSTVDPSLQAAHDQAVAPLTAFVRQVTQDADKALRRPAPKSQRELASCALSWIATWAKGDAWLGTMAQQQAEYQRKWDLAGVAIAYLKLKPFADDAQRRAIEPWLQRWADAAVGFFDDRNRVRNNHWYWLGLGLAAVGHGTDSPKHWGLARGIMEDAGRDIAADGTLPKELERQTRALFYHVFAVVPLVVMAELAATRGEDWYAFGRGALHRLVKTSHDGLKDPSQFDSLAGVAQERPVNPRTGWLPLYSARFPGRLTAPVIDIPASNRWTGGDVQVLSAVLKGLPIPQK